MSHLHTPVEILLCLLPQHEDLRRLEQMSCRCRQWLNLFSFLAPELYSNPQNYQKEYQYNRLDFFNQVFRQQVLYPSKIALLLLRISRSCPRSFCFNSSQSHIHIPSSKLGVPLSGSETNLSDRRFSCRVLPPQLATTADFWKGVLNTAVQRSLQSLSGSPTTVPLINEASDERNRKLRHKQHKGWRQSV